MSSQIPLRIATRKSPLALWQAHHVRQHLVRLYPDLPVELVEITTKGDKILDTPLANIGGKGLFVKELEHCLLENEADIAVHSMKDVPVELPEGLYLPVIMQREEPHDAFVSNDYNDLNSLPEGARVGTASLRRQCQLLALRSDLTILTLRGNVGTRLQKLDDQQFDAIVLAAAGLKRLGLSQRIRYLFPSELMLPAIGQGAIGIECRRGDQHTLSLIAALNDPITYQRVSAERVINQALGGSCQVPIAAYATVDGHHLCLRGLVGDVKGQRIIRSTKLGRFEDSLKLGQQLADDLKAQGADQLLAELSHENH
ncbi:hydroxymethylbilane synthase [Thioflexithrix psekupsensis]|uniref:Porphobilinogen deaminase n=1 Tax=Thioflexithrix psekupsensis TaxID=1570016 RepID=A0A251XBD6_9GAMM|nr:hydroxymethylbilane synthase [Thioflexithrix psekupsensis]OUD15386.1 hydroxymethylbilane synthase [Thioflexithrix psekupsensis]